MVFLIFCASTLGQLLFKSKSDYHILMLGSGTLIVGVILVGLSIQLESFLILFIELLFLDLDKHSVSELDCPQ